jgi:hypothetical protein
MICQNYLKCQAAKLGFGRYKILQLRGQSIELWKWEEN